MIRAIIVSLILVTSSGCISLKQAKGYPGPENSKAQTATLMGDWFVKIVTLDGNELSFDEPPKRYESLGGTKKSNFIDRRGFRISLAPGYHSLSYEWNYSGHNWNTKTLEVGRLKFYVEPGKSYYFHVAKAPEKNKYIGWIEEVLYEEKR